MFPIYKKKLYPFWFLIPALTLFTVLLLLPTVLGFGLAFTNWTSVSSEIHFVGWQNFIEIFTVQKNTLHAISNTLIFAVLTTVLKVLLGFAFALLLNKGIRGLNFFRACYFSPMMISSVVVSVLFLSILHPSTGFLNQFLTAIGLEGLTHRWLTDPKIALYTTVWIEVWKAAGFNMTVFLAGMQMIPEDIYEAVSVDGANAWQKVRYITIPFLIPSTTINVILGIISGINSSLDMIYPLTNGGPAGATEVLGISAFNSFAKGFYALSSAQNLLIFIIVMIISLSLLAYMKKKGEIMG